ncbi:MULTISPECIES: ABC transporter permease [Bacillota]|uniref:ABC transporter permease n=2 Tax=Amedibacillus TaxID=2749846 RepID=A0A7G9GM50_9FIRM|nr:MULTISPECIES: ABC transporter permease [Bacillota]QNM11882.1 ABC transporter permease [[Eubacterium] hominis]MCH4287195.1 ABC transporter permease [Amedibacillus hominis]RGB50610.1 ABC transporter permease [Absiella sp. AM22-9]RGB62887.1 ABC transporter permease [Absiella sp. AM10-20]RGB64812.1 ABC transporter permease [Absiella sp. AM09-45]
MSHLKLYWKLVKSCRKPLMIYFSIFITVFFIYASFLGDSKQTTIFQEVEPDIVWVDHDQSEASNALKSYMQDIAEIKDVGDTKKDHEDALFYGFVSFIVEVPKGFEDNLLAGKDTNIACTSRPDEVNASMLEMKIESYLSTMHIYHESDPALKVSQLNEKARQSVDTKLDISMRSNEELNISQTLRSGFFNYASYIFMALTMLSVGLIMTTIFKSNLQKRDLVSPISSNKRNFSLFVANILFGSALWAVFMVVIMFLPNSDMWTLQGFFYGLNLYIYGMLCVSVGFLFSCLLSNKAHVGQALNGLTNIVSLGSAFLGGAFVPQSLISESILTISHFIPTYWYVKTNDTLANLNDFNGQQFYDILSYMGIEVLFLIACFMIALLIMRNRKTQEAFISAGEQA